MTAKLIPYDLTTAGSELGCADHLIKLYRIGGWGNDLRLGRAVPILLIATPEIISLQSTFPLGAVGAFLRPLDRLWGDGRSFTAVYPVFR